MRFCNSVKTIISKCSKIWLHYYRFSEYYDKTGALFLRVASDD